MRETRPSGLMRGARPLPRAYSTGHNKSNAVSHRDRRSLLARSTGLSVRRVRRAHRRQAQDDPEQSRMGPGPERIEGQAIIGPRGTPFSSPASRLLQLNDPDQAGGVQPAHRSCQSRGASLDSSGLAARRRMFT